MRVYERLIKYTSYPTASNDLSTTHPSTPEQLVFGQDLVDEMKSLGIKDATIDENGYVFGTIESNIKNWSGTIIGFIAHMDVVDSVPFTGVKTRIIENYDGSKIILNSEQNITLDPKEFPYLIDYQGQDLLVTDGTTLLGADDKAGIAEIMTMVEHLNHHPEIKHGTIKIGFTPDEEIGKGACIHTGDAKDKLINASLLAMEFNDLLPHLERPEHTEQYEGFYHLEKVEGSVDKAKMYYILRDHDLSKLELRKTMVSKAADKLNTDYGHNTVQVEIKDTYYNMSEQIKPHWHLIDKAYEAIRELGGIPISRPVRGGTDGSRLSLMGLPCPNLGTGSHNHHGKTEFACIQAMDKCVELLVKIGEKYSVN